MRKILWIVCLSFLLLFLTGCRSQTENEAGPVAQEINLDSEKRLYVSAMFTDKVVVVDLETGSVEAEQNVGETPYGLALDRKRNQLLVACSLSNEVWCLDLSTLETKAVIEVGRLPAYISIDEEQRRAYVGNSGSDTISIIDLDTHEEIAKIQVGKTPVNLEKLPDNRLAVTLHDEAVMAIVDLENLQVVSTHAISVRPAGMAFDARRGLIYTGGHGAYEDNAVVRVHAVADFNDVRQIETPLMPIYLELTPDGNKLLSLYHRIDQLFVIDTSTGEILGEVNTGKLPFSTVLWDDGQMAAIANMDSNEIQIIDVEHFDTLKFIKVMEGPACMAVLDLT